MTTEGGGTLGLLDRGLYALFAHHAEDDSHAARGPHRAAYPSAGFGVYVARVYGLSWLALGVGVVGTATAAMLVPPETFDSFIAESSRFPVISRRVARSGHSPLVATVLEPALDSAKRGVFVAGNRYLSWVASARRADIAATLPGAVRYLRVLASGTHDRREMLRAVAEQDAYGETAVAFRRALNQGILTGSLEPVSSGSPARRLRGTDRRHWQLNPDSKMAEALERMICEMEWRLLSTSRGQHERAPAISKLLAELFVVLRCCPRSWYSSSP